MGKNKGYDNGEGGKEGGKRNSFTPFKSWRKKGGLHLSELRGGVTLPYKGEMEKGGGGQNCAMKKETCKGKD